MAEKLIFYYIPLLIDYIKIYSNTAVVTAIIETLYFFILKNKTKKFLILVFIVNIFSNITLNIFLSYKYSQLNILKGEISVIILEYVIFCIFLKPTLKKGTILFIETTIANLISFSTGLLLFNIQ